MAAFAELTAAGVTTRDAADLTGVSRATAGRPAPPRPGPAPGPGTPRADRDRPGTGVHLGHHQTGRPGQGHLLRRLHHDRHLLPLYRRCTRPRHRIRCPGRRNDAGGLHDPRHPAGRARRPRHLHDLENGRGAAHRSRCHPVGFTPSEVPHAFRTASSRLIHAADCNSRYSSWACCGVR